MFTVNNVSEQDDKVTFDIAYKLLGEIHTITVKDKNKATAYLNFIFHGFTFLKISLDLLDEKARKLQKHYFNPENSNIYGVQGWKDSWYQFRELRTELEGLTNHVGAYCKKVKENRSTFENLIPVYKELERSEIKEIISDILSLPDRLLIHSKKYYELTEEEYATN